MRTNLVLLITLVLTLLSAANSEGAILQFSALLDGLQEVPPVATPGFGDGLLTLDDSDGSFKVSGNFASLIGTTTAAHVHGDAPPGVAAGVVAPLTIDLGVTTGKYSGAGTFSKAQMTSLLGGLYYINVHTSFRPGGEIRGQLGLIPEPATITLFGIGAAMLLLLGWRYRAHRAG